MELKSKKLAINGTPLKIGNFYFFKPKKLILDKNAYWKCIITKIDTNYENPIDCKITVKYPSNGQYISNSDFRETEVIYPKQLLIANDFNSKIEFV